VSALQLEVGARTINIGEGLSAAEKDWLKRNVEVFLSTSQTRS
jgi:hypothetical protein